MSSHILFISGWGLSSNIWQPIIERLPQHQARHVNACPPADCLDITRWAELLADDLTPDTCIVGFSLGAMLSLALAHAANTKITRLVLIAASPKFVVANAPASTWEYGVSTQFSSQFMRIFSAKPQAIFNRFVALQAMGDTQAHAVRQQLQQHLLDPQANFASLLTALEILHTTDLRPICSSVQIPTLLIHGAQDQIMPLPAAQWLAHTLPNATLRVMDDCGHAPLCTHAAELAEWIEQHVTQ